MGSWIVDASIVVKWFVREANSPAANELIFQGHDLFAPDLVLIEIANALRKCVRAGLVKSDYAGTSLETLPRYFSELLPARTLLQDAFALACQLNHPIYDCIYLAASQNKGMPLITADAAFTAKIAQTAYEKHVVLLADWKP
jgi:predicted nucleic acid-binding protein